MNNQQKENDSSYSVLAGSSDLSLKDLFYWAQKNLILITVITGFFSFGSIIYSLTATEIYTAEIKVIASEEENGGSFGGAQGLAQLAGISLESEVTKYSEYMAILKSHSFLAKFLRKSGAKKAMFNTFSDWKAVEKFLSNHMSENRNIRTGITTLSLSWVDAKQASDWLNQMVKDLNQNILDRDLVDLKKRISNIESKIEETSDKTQRDILYSLMSQQMSNINLAESKQEYAIKVLDPSFPPEERSHPRRTRIVLFWTFIGFAFSLIVSFLMDQIRSKKPQ